MISNFGRLSGAVAAQLAPDVRHVFAGDCVLGGERHSREAIERWFERHDEDSQKAAHACEQMATLGIEQAAAAPIID